MTHFEISTTQKIERLKASAMAADKNYLDNGSTMSKDEIVAYSILVSRIRRERMMLEDILTAYTDLQTKLKDYASEHSSPFVLSFIAEMMDKTEWQEGDYQCDKCGTVGNFVDGTMWGVGQIKDNMESCLCTQCLSKHRQIPKL